MNYKEMIQRKNSIREYKKTVIEDKKIKEILNYALLCKKLIKNIEVECLIMSKDRVYQRTINIAGYGGNMIESPHYLVILSENKEDYLLNAGHLGERIILKAFDLGIDSCWITFPSSDIIKERLNIESDKEVVALISLGYADEVHQEERARKLADFYSSNNIEIDNLVSSKHNISDIVYNGEWGKKVDYEFLQTRMLLEPFTYARLAPSTLNRQPSRYIVDGSRVILAVRNDKTTNEYEESIDAGIQLLYFELVMAQTIMEIEWNIGKPEKEYKLADNYSIIAYCSI